MRIIAACLGATVALAGCKSDDKKPTKSETTTEKVKEKVKETAEEVKEKAGDVIDKAKERAGELGEKTKVKLDLSEILRRNLAKLEVKISQAVQDIEKAPNDETRQKVKAELEKLQAEKQKLETALKDAVKDAKNRP